MLDKEEWCIVRYRNTYAHLKEHEKKRLPEYDLLIRKAYQWEMVGHHLQGRWEIVARGFKSNEEALQFVNLFKE